MTRAALALAVLCGCAAPPPPQLPAPTTARPTVLADPRYREPRPIDARSAGVDASELAALDAEAARLHSDSMVLLKDGRVLLDRRYTRYADAPIELMSITKSVSALAVAMLLEAGTIESLDVPLTHYFPEWNQGNKKRITLRHVLTHTSGLQADDDTTEIWQSPDFVQLALTAELSTPPGTTFHYNDKAANLVGEIVRRASGERLDRFVAHRLFEPLGIQRFEWLRDPQGHTLVQSGLKLSAIDLARIGEMLRLRGAGLLGPRWVDALTQPATALHAHHGLFFWIPDSVGSSGSFAGRGYLGQHLVVLPERGVVAVRLRHWSPDATPGADDFDDFEHRIATLFAARPQ